MIRGYGHVKAAPSRGGAAEVGRADGRLARRTARALAAGSRRAPGRARPRHRSRSRTRRCRRRPISGRSPDPRDGDARRTTPGTAPWPASVCRTAVHPVPAGLRFVAARLAAIAAPSLECPPCRPAPLPLRSHDHRPFRRRRVAATARRRRPRAAGRRSGPSVMGLFHQYANWLVSISWKRFFVLSVLLLLVAVILQHLPPFSYTVGSVAAGSHTVAVVRRCRRCRRSPPGYRHRRRRRRRAPTSRRSRSRRRTTRATTSSSRSTATASASRPTSRSTATAFASARARHRRASGASAASSAAAARRVDRRRRHRDQAAARRRQRSGARGGQGSARGGGRGDPRVAEGDRRGGPGGGSRKPPTSAPPSVPSSAPPTADRRPHRQAHARPQVRRLPDRSGVAGDLLLGDPEDRLQAHHPGRGQGRGRDRDRRLGAAQAPGRRGAHGGDAGPGRAALPVQHAGLDRPPDRDRPAAREHDAEEPDRAAAGVDAVDARVEPGAAQPRPRDGGDPALPRDPEGADGRPPAGEHQRPRGPALGRVPADDDPVAGRERDQARPRAEGRGRHAHGRGRDRPRPAGRHRRRHRPRLRPRRHRRHRHRPGQHPRAAEAALRRQGIDGRRRQSAERHDRHPDRAVPGAAREGDSA